MTKFDGLRLLPQAVPLALQYGDNRGFWQQK